MQNNDFKNTQLYCHTQLYVFRHCVTLREKAPSLLGVVSNPVITTSDCVMIILLQENLLKYKHSILFLITTTNLLNSAYGSAGTILIN